MSNTRRFPLTMHRARQLQRGEVMRPGVMLGEHALNEMESIACRLDSVCASCGHNVCACVQIEAPPPAQLPAYDAWKRMVDNTIGALAQPTPTKFMREYMGEWRVQPEALPPLPPQPQGARDVRVDHCGCGQENMGGLPPGVNTLTWRGTTHRRGLPCHVVEPAPVDDGAVWQAQAMAQLNTLAPTAWTRGDYSVRAGNAVVMPDKALRTFWADVPERSSTRFADPLDALLWCFGFERGAFHTGPATIWDHPSGAYVARNGERWAACASKGASVLSVRPWWHAVAEALGKTARELGME